jgi:hypothetical protein
MKKGGLSSAIVATEYVPAVAMANNVERDTYRMLLEMRDYEYTGEESTLVEARKHLEGVKQSLRQAVQHGMNSTRVSQLKNDAEKATQSIVAYEKLMDETVTLANDLKQQRQASENAGRQYMAASHDFLASQKEAMQGEIIAGLDSDQLEKRLQQISLVSEIIEVGNRVIAGTWEAESKRDPTLLLKTLAMFDQATQKLDELQKICSFEGDMNRIAECRSAMLTYKTANTKLVDARADTANRRAVLADNILKQAKEIAVKGMEDMAQGADHAAHTLSLSSKAIGMGLAVGLLCSVALALLIVRGVSKSIKQVISALAASAAQVQASSDQVSNASRHLADGACEQASSLEESSASLEEISAMTRQSAENTGKADNLMQESKANVQHGVDAMHRMSDAIEKIKVSAIETSKIIKTIDEIAFQTNLLALNAAVEAARAGQAGLGFAVVAEEVRNLAQRSAEAARSTTDLIDGATKNAEAGVIVTKEIVLSLSAIQESTEKVAILITEIATASTEQAQGIGQVNTAVSAMDNVVQQNSASAEKSAHASAELSSQALELNDLVAQLLVIVGGQLDPPQHARHGEISGMKLLPH